MRERGIIFNAEMVRAVLEGRKTQTRRAIKHQPFIDGDFWKMDHAGWGRGLQLAAHGAKAELYLANHCPFGAVGDRLWVRESYRMPESLDHYSPQQVAEMALGSGYSKPWAPIQLEADGIRTGKWSGFNTPPMTTEPGKLRPSIHMPRWASRITLEITAVRVERLYAITLGDICKEFGCGIYDFRPATYGFQAWEELWKSIYGEESWQANPWVWVIEFKRVEGES